MCMCVCVCVRERERENERGVVVLNIYYKVSCRVKIYTYYIFIDVLICIWTYLWNYVLELFCR